MNQGTGINFQLVQTYYHISPEGAEEPILELPAVDLLKPEVVGPALDQGGALVQSVGRKLPGSFVGTTFFNLCAVRLMILSFHNRVLDLDLDNLTFQIERHDDHAHLGYRIHEVRWVMIPEEARADYMASDWAQFIGRVVRPGVEAVAEAAGLKPSQIWNQFGGNLIYMKDYIRKLVPQHELLERLDEEMQVLLGLESAVFGLRRNPFQHSPQYVDNPYQPGSTMMLRSACCFYDAREGGEKCYNCPRLTPEEREQRRQEILEAAANP